MSHHSSESSACVKVEAMLYEIALAMGRDEGECIHNDTTLFAANIINE